MVSTRRNRCRLKRSASSLTANTEEFKGVISHASSESICSFFMKFLYSEWVDTWKILYSKKERNGMCDCYISPKDRFKHLLLWLLILSPPVWVQDHYIFNRWFYNRSIYFMEGFVESILYTHTVLTCVTVLACSEPFWHCVCLPVRHTQCQGSTEEEKHACVCSYIDWSFHF